MKLLISLVLALTVQGEVFEPSESSTTPEIAEKSAKGGDEENLLGLLSNHANPEDEAAKNLKPGALEGAKTTTEMAGGVGAAVLGEKLKSGKNLRRRTAVWGRRRGHHHRRRGGWMNFGSAVALRSRTPTSTEASCTENSALARALRRWDVALVAVG